MSITIYILLAIIAVAVLAYAIVNLIPKKLHWLLSLIFLGLIGYLSYLIYTGIMRPIKFDNKKKAKYAKVIDNLKMIKDAQIAHKKIVGGYAAKPEDLVRFVDTAKFALTQTRTETYKKKVGALTLDKERRVVDTIGFKPLVNDFKGRNYKDMFNVPGTSAKFQMEVDSLEKAGIKSQVFRARIDKAIVLDGMDEKLIKEEKQALGGIQVKGEYISVGSLSDLKVSGNWPPFYDKRDTKSKK